MSNYRIEDILWSRHVPMRTDIFDFQRGEWNINWDKLGVRKDAPIEPPTPLLEDELFEAPDYIDLAILSELQVNATRPLSKISSDIKVKEDTVHYHYAEHVKKRNLISNYMVSWVGGGSVYNRNTVCQVIFRVDNLSAKELREVERVFHIFPFSWLEFLTGTDSYYLFSNIPSNLLNAAMHFISQSLGNLEEKLTILMYDTFESGGFPIPVSMFNKERGWEFNKANVINNFESHFIRDIQMPTPMMGRKVVTTLQPFSSKLPIV